MELNEYQRAALRTAVYPGMAFRQGFEYTLFGMLGEGGELANKYKKMKGGKSRKMTLGSIKRRLSSILKMGKSKKSKKNVSRRHRGTKRQRGGYNQWMSNVAYTPSYSTGGNLSPNMSALANPAPYKLTNNCVDNYNHFTGKSNL